MVNERLWLTPDSPPGQFDYEDAGKQNDSPLQEALCVDRPSSQPAPVSRLLTHTRSANHVAQKPADANVLSSIIASFDIVNPPIVPSSRIRDVSPRRPPIRKAPSMPAPTLRHSIGRQGHDSASAPVSIDQDHDDGPADFPVIRTSRRPPGRPAYPPPSPSASSSGSLKDYFRTAPRNSMSSLSLTGLDNGKSKLCRSNSRLSAEGWSKRLSSASLSSFETKSDVPSRNPSIRSSVLNRNSSARRFSNETVRPGIIREERVTAMFTDSPPTSPARRSLAPDLHEMQKENWPQALQTPPSTELVDPPKKNPIADAIPLRVSSLMSRTSSPRKKKVRGSKQDKITHGPEPHINDSTQPTPLESPDDTNQNILEGLGDNDTTVMRIKELKQKKEDRLKSEMAAAKSDDGPADSTLSSTDTTLPAPIQPDWEKSSSKTANRTSARAPDVRKAHRVLGLDEPSTPNQGRELKSPGLGRHATEPLLTTHRPQSSNDFITITQLQHSVDVHAGSRQSFGSSYAQAVYALQEAQRDASVTGIASAALHSINRPDPDVDSNKTPPSTEQPLQSRPRGHSRSSSNHLDRWSHPDIPLQTGTGDRTRRKSMSDARGDALREEEILEERRNSVNASVQEYLAAPRLNRKIRHGGTGRLISFSEVGDPQGAAVIVCVGMGLTRYITAFYDELAATLGLRLITLDRPGVGGSEPYPDRERVSPLSWPDDVVTVTQHLGISQFSLLAHSAGAIYALATALTLPHCIKGKVQLLAPWIPPSQFDTYGIKDHSRQTTPVSGLPRSQRFLRVLPIPFLKVANGGLFSPSSLKPIGTKNNTGPLPSPKRDGVRNIKLKRRPEPLRRESMILLDQVVPERPIATMFPLPGFADEDMSGLQPLRRPSLGLTATATPTDPEWTYVAEALDAAEHSARERQSAFSSLLTEQTWMLATHNSNPAVDLIVCLERHRDIGFRYVDIQRPIVMTHGSEDKRVPVENVRWIGEQINRRATQNWSPDAKQEFRERGGCEVRVLAGEGHGLMASPGVMADVLADISKDWARRKW